MDTYSTVYNYSPQYSFCAVYICYSFHNVIFFHNHCPIHSTTMSTAYPQHIHTVLFTITQPSILYVLFTYASFSQCDIISQSLHNWLYNNVYSISSTYTYGIVTITLPSILTLLFIYASFTQCDIFPQWLHNSLYNNVYSIFSTYTYNTIYNYTTQYTNCAVYIYFPFHNVNIFPQYYIIVYSTMFTVRLHWTLTVLFTITLPSILTLLFIYASFTQCDIFSQSLPNSFYNNVYSISATYTYSTVYNYTTQYTVCAFTYASFSQCDIISQSLPNSLYNNVYSISSTYTYNTIYNYTTQYTDCAVYIGYPFHNVTFFHNYCTIDSTTMSTAYPQHIHTVLLQLQYPVYWLCCLYMLPLHNVTFFHNYCTIDSTTMSTAYPQHIHIVLFTTTLHSILALLFIYAYLTQCDIFSQLLHNWLYNNVYSIFATYTYSTVCNYCPQYTGFAVYICFPSHNVIFFHNDCTIHSTTMFTAYSQHIHTVLFTITLPS